MSDEEVKICVRLIGGSKVHPVFAHRKADGSYYGLRFACRCPNTANGTAAHRAYIVGEGWERRNCKS